jgi:hypothetical protein
MNQESIDYKTNFAISFIFQSKVNVILITLQKVLEI